MKGIINKLLIVIYAFYFHLIYYRSSHYKDNKDILIIHHGYIGDAILFADYMAMFSHVFPLDKGYRIEALCFKNTKPIWQQLFNHEYQIEFLDVDIDGTEKTWVKYRKVLQFFRKRYYQKIFVLPFANSRIDRIVYNISGKEKIACGENEVSGKWRNRYLIHRYFYEHAYNVWIRNPLETMEIRRYADLIQRYADFPVPIKISHIQIEEKKTPVKYCLIGLGASGSEKIWEPTKFLEIINYLWNKYHLESYICGEEREKVLYEQMKTIEKGDHIKSYIGKTNLNEWISLIKGASLYLGNDSAGAHIAAAVAVPAVVVVGKWQYKRFFPYDKELEAENEILPYPVFSKFQYECINCREKYMKKGIGNKKCMKAIKNGSPCLCIADITVQQVKEAVDMMIIKHNIMMGNN